MGRRRGAAAPHGAAEVTVRAAGLPLPLSAVTVRRAARAALAARGGGAGSSRRRVASLGITFLTRPAIQRLNREWLGHDWPTDVVSFPLAGPDGRVRGDVYVCPAVARQEARARGIPTREELIRLVVHGTLHILGYDHPAGPERMRSAMWRRQERLVRRLA